jgi:hypothetical protein
MPGEREWLQAEQGGQDAIAEAMFARLIADMPPIEPGDAFVERTVRTAWRARRRHRVVTRVARLAAGLLLTVMTVASLYEFSVLVAGLVARGTVVFSHAFVWLLTSARDGARWWWIAGRIGAAVSDALASPLTAAAVMAVETAILLGMYAFRHLLHNGTQEPRIRT